MLDAHSVQVIIGAQVQSVKTGMPCTPVESADRIAALCDLGDVVHLHCVGRNQRAFIETFGAKVLPGLG